MKFALLDFGTGREYWFSILRFQLNSWIHSKSLFRIGTEEFLAMKLTAEKLPAVWRKRFVVELLGIMIIKINTGVNHGKEKEKSSQEKS